MGQGRVGVPLHGKPSREWTRAFRQAAARERPGDERWKHAAETVTADEIEGVMTLVFLTGAVPDASFIMSYQSAIDSAIAEANDAST